MKTTKKIQNNKITKKIQNNKITKKIQKSKIPKKIFFIYIQGVNKIPKEFMENINFIKSKNTDYDIELYDYKKFINYLDQKNLVKNKKYFLKLNPKIYALLADYMRFVLLYNEGGVYLDLKSRPKMNLNDIIINNKTVFIEHTFKEYTEYIIQFLITSPKQEIFKLIIDKIHSNIDNYNKDKIHLHQSKSNVLNLTGNRMVLNVINEYLKKKKNNIRIIKNEERSNYFINHAVKNYRKKYKSIHYGRMREHLVI